MLRIPEIHNQAVSAIVKIGAPAIPALVRELDSPLKDVREAAAPALVAIGEKAVYSLVDFLVHKTISAGEYEEATIFLDKPNDRAKAIQLAQWSNESVKSVSDILVSIGKPAVRALIKSLEHKPAQAVVARALGLIGDADAADALCKVFVALSREYQQSVNFLNHPLYLVALVFPHSDNFTAASKTVEFFRIINTLSCLAEAIGNLSCKSTAKT